MKLLFAGTPDLAVSSLVSLAKTFDVVVVLSAPDRPRGRRREPQPTSVSIAADRLGIPVLTPERLDSTARKSVVDYAPDLLVVVAYGKIFGPKFLELFEYGGINLHPSMLPKLRGPAPIPAAILGGERTLGVSVQRVALKMDAGDLLSQEAIPLDGSETTVSISRTVAEVGARMLVETVAAIESGAAIGVPQVESAASYCTLIEKSDGLIDWADSAVSIERAVRAYTPWPTAFTFFCGNRLSILESHIPPRAVIDATRDSDVVGTHFVPGTVVGVDKREGILIQTGHGTLAVDRLHLQSKKPLGFHDFMNGSPEIATTVLGGRT